MKPPIGGPKMKPKPKAAPIMPRALARFSRSVTSVMYACEVAMLAEPTPAIARATSSTAMVCALASNRKAMAVINTVPAITGRRPCLSLKLPQNGEKMKFMSAYTAMMRPTMSDEAPSSVA
jgi:hypothetical protein